MKTSLLGVLFICAAMLGTVSAQKNSLLSAEDVWNRAVAAKGGHERLRAIHTLVWSSDYSSWTSLWFGGVHYEFVESYPDRVWLWEDHRPHTLGFGAQVWNGGKRLDWAARKGGAAIAVPWSEEAARFVSRRTLQHQLLFLLESSVFRPVPRAVVRTSSGPVLEFTLPGFTSVKVTLDETTSLPKLLVFVPDFGPNGPPASEQTFTIEGYVDVDGIKMPKRVRELGDMRFVFNPNLNPALFESPPDNVFQRDHWKTFLVK